MKKIILAIMITFTYTYAQTNQCRSLVRSAPNKIRGLTNEYNRMDKWYKEDLQKMKDGTLGRFNTSMLYNLKEKLKKLPYMPSKYDINIQMRETRRAFMRECGGFNARDRKSTREVVMMRWEIRDKAIAIIKDPYFARHWKRIGNLGGVGSRAVVFKGIADYR